MKSQIITIIVVVLIELSLLSFLIPSVTQLQTQCSLQRKKRDNFWDDFESETINPQYRVKSVPNATIQISNVHSFSGSQSLYIESNTDGDNPEIEFTINWDLDSTISSLANISFQFLPERYFAFMILTIQDTIGRTFGIEYGNPQRFWTDDPTFISGDQALFVNQNNNSWFLFNRNIQNEIERALATAGSPFENFTLSKVISLLIATDPPPTALYIDDLRIIDSYIDNSQLEINLCILGNSSASMLTKGILIIVVFPISYFVLRKFTKKESQSATRGDLYPTHDEIN